MNSILPNSRKHDLAFHASGKIDISAHIARCLQLAPGDVIDIASERGELFLYVRLRAGHYSGRHEGRVWTTTHGKGTFRAWSRSLARAILSTAGAHDTLRCPCGSIIYRNNITYITIIYRCSL